jgi:L-fuconate dehydratase
MFDFIAVSGTMEGRVIEFVDHLHEHFEDPVVMQSGRYMAPTRPGYSITIKPESRNAYRFPDGAVWKAGAFSPRR